MVGLTGWRGGRAMMAEGLEPRRLMAFSDADVSGTWGLVSMSAAGDVQLDGAGHLTGGAVRDAGGGQENPTGTYAVGPSGSVVVVTDQSLTGGINAAKDVVVVSRAAENKLAVLVRSGAATFSARDLSGTWDVFSNGAKGKDDPKKGKYIDNSGHGTLKFDGAGHVTGSVTEDESGRTKTFGGTYTVAADGTVTVLGAKLGTLVGRMNASKNLVALGPADLAGAAARNESRMVVAVKRAGKYTAASVKGNWELAMDKGIGALNLNGKGKVSGVLTTKSGANGVVSGTYSLNATGVFSATILTTDKQGKHTNRFAGVVSGTKDFIAFDQPGVAGRTGWMIWW